MTNIDLILSVILPMFLIILSLAALFWKKIYRRENSADFFPKCGVFVPCKGISENFSENIERFFCLSYPNYDLYFAVENENDSATSIIREKIEFHKKGTLIISQETKTCGQKNLNLVRAVDVSDKNTEVLVFADSDIAPVGAWLETLTGPLKNKKIAATSGFRWLYSKTNGLGSQIHSFQNYILYVLFVFSAKIFNSGLWGGSMAMRKEDYDALKVRDRWLETSVDDLSLAEITVKAKKKIHFCFDAITDTDDTIKLYNKCEKWYIRQVQYLKYHIKRSWISAILLSVLSLAFFARVLVVSFLAVTQQNWTYLLVPACFFAGIFIFAAMFGLHGTKNKLLTFVLYSPISLFNVCVCVVKTIFINVIDWSGYRYFMRFWSGKVWKVEKI